MIMLYLYLQFSRPALIIATEERGEAMAEKTRQAQAVITNLADAGCSDEMIEQFMGFLESGEKESGLFLLAKHRRFLLDCYHADQKKIDCLDYLIYRLKE